MRCETEPMGIFHCARVINAAAAGCVSSGSNVGMMLVDRSETSSNNSETCSRYMFRRASSRRQSVRLRNIKLTANVLLSETLSPPSHKQRFARSTHDDGAPSPRLSMRVASKRNLSPRPDITAR